MEIVKFTTQYISQYFAVKFPTKCVFACGIYELP